MKNIEINDFINIRINYRNIYCFSLGFLTRTKKDSSSSFSIGETFNLDNNVEMIIHSAKFIQDPENSYEESLKY